MAERSRNGGITIYTIVQAFPILTYAFFLLARIPLSKMVGDAGIGYLSGGFEVYMLWALLLGVPMTKTIASQVRSRLRREQYRNAKVYWNCALQSGLLMTVLIAVVNGIGAKWIAANILKAGEMWLIVLLLAPSIFCMLISSLMKGNLQAQSVNNGVILGYILELILQVAGILVGAHLIGKYGAQVAALLRKEELTSVYGATGAMAGFMVAELLIMIYWIVLVLFSDGGLRKLSMGDQGRRNETSAQLMPLFIETTFLTGIRYVMFQLPIIVLQRMYITGMIAQEQGDKAYALWGSFYAKYLPIIGLMSALCVCGIPYHVNRIGAMYEKQDLRMLRSRVEKSIQRVLFMAIPASIFVAVVQTSYIGAFFEGMTTTVAQVISSCSFVILLYSVAYLTNNILAKTQYVLESLLIPVGSFVIAMFFGISMVSKGQKGLMGVGITLMIFYGLMSAVGLGLIIWRFRCRIDVMSVLLFPVMLAAVCGFVMVLLNKLLLESVGALITLIISLVVGYLGYMIAAILLDVLTEEQLEKMFLGRIFIYIGHSLNILS